MITRGSDCYLVITGVHQVAVPKGQVQAAAERDVSTGLGLHRNLYRPGAQQESHNGDKHHGGSQQDPAPRAAATARSGHSCCQWLKGAGFNGYWSDHLDLFRTDNDHGRWRTVVTDRKGEADITVASAGADGDIGTRSQSELLLMEATQPGHFAQGYFGFHV